MFPQTNFFREDWKKFFNIDVEARVEPLDKEFLISQLMAPCPLVKGKKVWETHTLLELPKDLTVNKLLASEPQVRLWFDLFDHDIMRQLGDKAVPKTHFVLIANDILEESMNINFDALPQLMAKYPGYEKPDFFTAVAVNIAKFVKEGKRLYRMHAFTCCQDVINKENLHSYEYPAPIVGDFGESGFIVYHYQVMSKSCTGVAPMRRLILP